MELFANNAGTTLAAAVTSTSATTITVASSAGFPAVTTASGNFFRIVIGTEYLRVTNVNGVTWTVTRGQSGSTATTHLSGAAVTHVVTAGALAQLVASANTQAHRHSVTTQASPPTTPHSVGDLWTVSDLTSTAVPATTPYPTQLEGSTLWVYGHSYTTSPGVACTLGAEYYNNLRERHGMNTPVIPSAAVVTTPAAAIYNQSDQTNLADVVISMRNALTSLRSVGSYGVDSGRMIDIYHDLAAPSAVGQVSGATWISTRTGLALIDAMFNDMLNPPSQVSNPDPVPLTTLQVQNWRETLNACMAVVSSASRVESSTGTVSGTWTTSTQNTQYSGGSQRYTSEQGAFIDIPVTVTSSGVAYVVLLALAPAPACDITADGVHKASVTAAQLDAEAIYSRRAQLTRDLFPYAVRLTGLTPGTVTIRVTKTDATTNLLAVDAVYPRKPEPMPVLVAKDMEPTLMGVNKMTQEPGRGVMVANRNLLTAAVDAVAAEWTNMIVADFLPVTQSNSFTSLDGVHPNDRGMRKMTNIASTALTNWLYNNDPDALYGTV